MGHTALNSIGPTPVPRIKLPEITGGYNSCQVPHLYWETTNGVTSCYAQYCEIASAFKISSEIHYKPFTPQWGRLRSQIGQTFYLDPIPGQEWWISGYDFPHVGHLNINVGDYNSFGTRMSVQLSTVSGITAGGYGTVYTLGNHLAPPTGCGNAYIEDTVQAGVNGARLSIAAAPPSLNDDETTLTPITVDVRWGDDSTVGVKQRDDKISTYGGWDAVYDLSFTKETLTITRYWWYHGLPPFSICLDQNKYHSYSKGHPWYTADDWYDRKTPIEQFLYNVNDKCSFGRKLRGQLRSCKNYHQFHRLAGAAENDYANHIDPDPDNATIMATQNALWEYAYKNYFINQKEGLESDRPWQWNMYYTYYDLFGGAYHLQGRPYTISLDDLKFLVFDYENPEYGEQEVGRDIMRAGPAGGHPYRWQSRTAEEGVARMIMNGPNYFRVVERNPFWKLDARLNKKNEVYHHFIPPDPEQDLYANKHLFNLTLNRQINDRTYDAKVFGYAGDFNYSYATLVDASPVPGGGCGTFQSVCNPNEETEIYPYPLSGGAT